MQRLLVALEVAVLVFWAIVDCLEAAAVRRWLIDVLDNVDTITGHPHYPFCEWLAASDWWGADARDFHPPAPAR